MCSVVIGNGASGAIEVGLFGREAMTDQALECDETALFGIVVQQSGTAYGATAEAFATWLRNRPSALRLLARFQQTVFVQAAHTALSHGSFTINVRLARWLLMSFDRTDRHELPLRHEFQALRLAVRRAGITTAIHFLEGEGAIRARRGQIALKDRLLLEKLAGGSYGIPEREYDRLMGPIAYK